MVVALAGGCGGSTEPSVQAVAGTYVLLSVNGQSLPYEYHRRVLEGGTVTLNVYDARLEFRTRNRVFDIRTLDFLAFGPDTLVSGYQQHGATLLLSRTATNAYVAHTDTATVEDSVITLRRRHLPGELDINAVFVYVRRSP